MTKQSCLLPLFFFLLSACSTAPMPVVTALPQAPVVLNSTLPADQQAFVDRMVKTEQFNAGDLQKLFLQAKVNPVRVRQMDQPLESLTWGRYQQVYVRPSLIEKGQIFLQENHMALAAAETQYGVPSQIIVGILGVETNYGGNEGESNAFNALFTLAFNYPRRAAFFQNELASYLLLTRETGWNPLTLKSSYAGALGMPQFMPSVYQQYAVSNSQNYPDLFHNTNDAIGSVGNYLSKMGWQRGGPIVVKADLSKAVVLTDSLKNDTLTLLQFKKEGIHAEYKMPGDLQACLLVLQGQAGPEYWLAFHNFYVIKRYNASNLYAMAVWELGERILAEKPNDGNS